MVEEVKNTLVALEILGVDQRLTELENKPVISSGSGGLSPTTASATYVPYTGATTDINIGIRGLIMSDGVSTWRVTIDSTGALVSTLKRTGSSVGVGYFMFVTYT